MPAKATEPEVDPANVFLTPAMLAKRWGGVVSVGTLGNWRYRGIGPKPFRPGGKKKGRALYRLVEVLAYEQRQTKGG